MWLRTAVLAVLLLAAPVHAGLELGNATVRRLDNGLTVILLEDRNFPVVSVQVLYRVGARNETAGKTGLAHFVEHMAFRASENFPGTELVSRIYAEGGEWHGYTWTDQTTYFSTVAKDDADLLLRIEADRMARLELSPDVIDAERGAVLAEMHMYENDPSSLVLDQLMFSAFVAHPYRNNTIGFESDIESVTFEDVADFYAQHYHPANAVLAVVGDFETEALEPRIAELFGALDAGTATPLPHTREPRQHGVRRAHIAGTGETRRFAIGYHAPSVTSPDYPAFLVLQALLGASGGVSFLQNDWGVPVADDALLAGVSDTLTTWYPPSAQPYLFVIAGDAAAEEAASDVEAAVETRVATARNAPPAATTLGTAIEQVTRALVFDIETTEDAAHQLAFFAGLDALDVLLALPARVAAVSTDDVHRVAGRYLRPEARTIVWFTPVAAADDVPADVDVAAPVAPQPAGPPDREPAGRPVAGRLGGGVPVVVRASDLSPTVAVKLVVPGNTFDGASVNDPDQGYSSLAFLDMAPGLPGLLDRIAKALAEIRISAPAARPLQPEARLEAEFTALMDAGRPAAAVPRSPFAIVVSGDVDPATVFVELERVFGSLPAAPRPSHRVPIVAGDDRVVRLGLPVAQAAVGYLSSAPGASEPASDAWRLLLYVLSHGYEGRLGVEAISRRGLAYYIDSRYRSDGTNGWVTMQAGVDPGKVDAFAALMRQEVDGLVENPPTEAEIAEARNHLLGRFASAAQSNTEIVDDLAARLVWRNALDDAESLRQRLDAITVADVHAAARMLASGMVIVVRE